MLSVVVCWRPGPTDGLSALFGKLVYASWWRDAPKIRPGALLAWQRWVTAEMLTKSDDSDISIIISTTNSNYCSLHAVLFSSLKALSGRSGSLVMPSTHRLLANCLHKQMSCMYYWVTQHHETNPGRLLINPCFRIQALLTKKRMGPIISWE